MFTFVGASRGHLCDITAFLYILTAILISKAVTARVNEGFTSHVHPQIEWAMSAFTPQLHSMHHRPFGQYSFPVPLRVAGGMPVEDGHPFGFQY